MNLYKPSRAQWSAVNYAFPWRLNTLITSSHRCRCICADKFAMSNYSQQEDAYDRYEEKILTLSSFIYAIGYGSSLIPTQNEWLTSPLGTGAQLVLYSNCVSLFWKQRNSQRKHACMHLAYITLIFILETLVMATAIWVLVNLYINDRDYPGGPMAYYLTAQPIGSTIFGSFFALNFMCDWLIVSIYIQFSYPHP